MPWRGLEPRRLAAPPPQDGVSTNFTTRANSAGSPAAGNPTNYGSDGARTRDPQLGKLMLCQLSYSRKIQPNLPQ